MGFSRGTKEKAVAGGKSVEMLPSWETSAEALASVSGCFRRREELGARGSRTERSLWLTLVGCPTGLVPPLMALPPLQVEISPSSSALPGCSQDGRSCLPAVMSSAPSPHFVSIPFLLKSAFPGGRVSSADRFLFPHPPVAAAPLGSPCRR